ncbi:glycosyltransferase [bacterium]|nr:glycosyltransferase [bacterium]
MNQANRGSPMPPVSSDTSPVFDASIAFVFSDAPSYVRARRTLPTLRRLFREVHFIGVTRKRSWDDSRTPGIHYHIVDLQLSNGLATVPGVARFMRYIRWKLQQLRPDVTLVVNDEYTLPFAAGYLPRSRFVAVDMHDSIGMRVLGPGAKLRPLFRRLSELGLRAMDGLVEVTPERLQWHRYRPPVTAVVHNSPPYEEVTAEKGLPKKFVYVNGNLEDNIHGVEAVLAAVDRVEGMEIVSTGKTVGPFVETVFRRHPKVHHLGKVHPDRLLPIAKAATAMYCHYSPVRLNYVYGAPNKLYEAMMVGTPVLINAENQAKSMIEEHGFGLISPYNDVDALARDLRRLRDGDPAVEQAAQRAREVFRTTYSWDIMETVWEDFFRRMGVTERNGG